MLKTLSLNEIKLRFGSIPEELKEKIESIKNEKSLKLFFQNLPDYKNLYEIKNALNQSISVFGKDGLSYQQNYDAMIKWIAQEFRGKTLALFGLETNPISDVFTLEPVEIHVKSGRLDIVFKDEAGAYYHCEEQRNMSINDLHRCSIYHFQTVSQLGLNVTDFLLISGQPYTGPQIIESKSGVYRPLIIDLTGRDGQKRLSEIQNEIQNNNFDSLIELVFVPLYGKEKGKERSNLAIKVIDFEIELLKKDQMYQNLVFATLVMCNKLVDKEILKQYYEEIANMIDILEIAEEKGREKGLKEMLLEALDEKIGILTPSLVENINSITQRETLKSLLRQAIRSDSLSHFEGKLAQVTS